VKVFSSYLCSTTSPKILSVVYHSNLAIKVFFVDKTINYCFGFFFLQIQTALGSPIDKSEVAALREELKHSQTNLVKWHESWKQAQQACEAWKKEAEEMSGKAHADRERIEELEQALREAENKMRIVQGQGPIRALAENAELSRLPMSNLEQIQQLLRRDLERVDTVSLFVL